MYAERTVVLAMANRETGLLKRMSPLLLLAPTFSIPSAINLCLHLHRTAISPSSSASGDPRTGTASASFLIRDVAPDIAAYRTWIVSDLTRSIVYVPPPHRQPAFRCNRHRRRHHHHPWSTRPDGVTLPAARMPAAAPSEMPT
ncbi:hypothetical protein V8C44DRAFT_314892 [Trichoderma aethiopicum]